MTKEKYITPYSAYIILLIHFFLLIISLLMFVPDSFGPFAIFFLLLSLIMVRGYFVNPPNEALVFTLFGTYQATTTYTGFYWVNPFYKKQRISLKVHSVKVEKEIIHEAKSKKVKVSAIINWKVNAPSLALFETENYIEFVNLQAEATLNEITATTLYDIINEKSKVVFMPDKSTVIHQLFEKKLINKLKDVGIEILDIRIG